MENGPLFKKTSPRYLQIAADLRHDIASHRYYPGDKLPTTRRLAKSLDVHYHTVRKAYEVLARVGLVTMKPRQSVCVSPHIWMLRPSAGQRHAFIGRLIRDAEYMHGLSREQLCQQISSWKEPCTVELSWPESMGLDGNGDVIRTDTGRVDATERDQLADEGPPRLEAPAVAALGTLGLL